MDFRELNPEVFFGKCQDYFIRSRKKLSGKYRSFGSQPVLANQLYVLMRIIIFWPIRCLPETVGEITEIQELIQHFGAQHIFEITGLPPNEFIWSSEIYVAESEYRCDKKSKSYFIL